MKKKIFTLLQTITIFSLTHQIDFTGTKVIEVFDKKTKLKYNVEGPFINIIFTSLNDGYLAISFGKQMCPGDVIILSYERSPKILDCYCKKHLSDAKEDYIYGGKNDWEIVKSKKETGKGYIIEARRSLRTQDRRLDFQFVRGGRQPKFINYAYSETEHDFRVDSDGSGSSPMARIYQEFDL